jgi:poly-gamma-glutamate synthesis protein (capsule biosynthesis protein)
MACTVAYIALREDPEPILTSVVHIRDRSQSAQVVQETPEARILFVGDMMFDRSVRKVGEAKGYEYLFSCIEPYLSNVDGVIGNLEGPVTSYPSISIHRGVGQPGNTQFTFDATVPSVLARYGFIAVSLANNHIRDFGPIGIDQTRAALDAVGLAYIGDPRDRSTDVTHLTVNDIPITLVAFNQFGGSAQDTIRALEAHQDRTTVVFAHWGDEYVPASTLQKELAKAFVGAGADLIIGAHPHVIQGHEVIDSTPVYYSLGNFIFDQYWKPEVTKGMGVVVQFTHEGLVNLEPIMFTLTPDRRTCLKI